jgi:hypothetical protein
MVRSSRPSKSPQVPGIKRVKEQDNPQHRLKPEFMILSDIGEGFAEHGQVQLVKKAVRRSLGRHDVPGGQHDLELPLGVTSIPVFDEICHCRCKNEEPI